MRWESLKHVFETPIYQLNVMDCLLMVVLVLAATVVIEGGGWLCRKVRGSP